jgi:hypothetical protein
MGYGPQIWSFYHRPTSNISYSAWAASVTCAASVIRPFLPSALFEQLDIHRDSIRILPLHGSQRREHTMTLYFKLASEKINYRLVIRVKQYLLLVSRSSPSQPSEAVQKPLEQVRNHAAALRHLMKKVVNE